MVRGQDDRPVEPNRERKSLSVERTYATDLNSENEIYTALDTLLQELMRRYQNDDQSAHTVVMKLRFDDFSMFVQQEHDRRRIVKNNL